MLRVPKGPQRLEIGLGECGSGCKGPKGGGTVIGVGAVCVVVVWCRWLEGWEEVEGVVRELVEAAGGVWLLVGVEGAEEEGQVVSKVVEPE